MAILFPDNNTEVKCEKCGAITFEEIPIYIYKKVKDRKGEALKKELCCIKLKCSICGEDQHTINDLRKHRIVE